MSPVFLLTEQVVRECGEGRPVPIDGPHDGPIRLTLEITRIIQQENLEVAILGSSDGRSWQRLAAFPHKSYCGTYSMILDPPRHRDIQYLKTQWSVDRWQSGEKDPLFGFYVFAEDVKARAAGVA
jgi:hypothetical protein